MSAVDGGNEPRYQLAEARTALIDLQQRVVDARAGEREALHGRVRTAAKARESLADCQGYIATAGAYATVAQDLLDLGLIDQAEVVLGLGMDYVDIAQDCLDHLS
jgi:hypothetical protein